MNRHLQYAHKVNNEWLFCPQEVRSFLACLSLATPPARYPSRSLPPPSTVKAPTN